MKFPEYVDKAIQRFLDRVCPEPNTGCWLWGAGASKDGYGAFNFAKKNYKTHRLSYIFFVGPIPYGMCVLHKCDVTLCVNPSHLFLGTDKDNATDAINKGIVDKKGENHHNAKLTEEDVRRIRQSNKTQKETARYFGITRSNVSYIQSRKTWKHVK